MRLVLLLLALLACSSKRDSIGPPVIAISVTYPGASAETIEATIALPIERAVAPFAKSIETRCESDHVKIEVELSADADPTVAALEINHAVIRMRAELPVDADPPVITRTRKHDQPIVWLAVRGALPITEVSRFAQELALDLKRTNGIGGIEEHGLAERSILVQPDLARLVAFKLTLFDVLAALQSTEVSSVALLGDVVLRDSIRVRDIADIAEGFEREPGAGPPVLAVHAQVAASRAKVLADVRARVASLDLPPGLTIAEVPSPSPPRPPAPIVATVVGDDLAVLRVFADGVTADLRGAGITDVVRDPAEGGVIEAVQTDRERALALDVQMPDVAATLRAMTSTRVGRIDKTPIVLKVVTQKLPLDQVFVRNTKGSMVPLSAIVTTKQEQAQVIVRHNGRRAIALAIYAPEAQLATARKIIKARALPEGHFLVLRD